MDKITDYERGRQEALKILGGTVAEYFYVVEYIDAVTSRPIYRRCAAMHRPIYWLRVEKYAGETEHYFINEHGRRSKKESEYQQCFLDASDALAHMRAKNQAAMEYIHEIESKAFAAVSRVKEKTA